MCDSIRYVNDTRTVKRLLGWCMAEKKTKQRWNLASKTNEHEKPKKEDPEVDEDSFVIVAYPLVRK